jgi:hypothetical protein
MLYPGTEITLELLVCYQVRLTESADWDIGVTALQWRGANETNYWQNQPNDRWDLVLTDQEAQNDDLNPDIAYNHLNGNVYLVWSNVEDDQYHQRIRYVRYDRANNTITPEYYAQTVEANGHNGHDPSIDVDLVSVPPDRYWVAIAYTSQFEGNHISYHVCYTGFSAVPLADGDHNTTEIVRNHDFWNLGGGLASIDISPNGNANHIVAIAFEQETGTDGFGPITSIYVKQVQSLIQTSFYQVPPGGNYFDGMNPSLAIELQGSLQDPITASVTFMAQSPQSSATLHPYGRRVQLRPSLSLGPGLDLAPAAAITGNYNGSDIPFINPGMSTAIVTLADDSYWAAWCDRTEMEPPPEEVWASWGFIE